MRLDVFVQGQRVAWLDANGDFEHILTYLPEADPGNFVSLLMPVRSKSWTWPELHPFFQMNLPEGYLLKILQERFGPHIGAQPLSLLAVVGRNTIGRVQVVPEGAALARPPTPMDVRDLLQGDHSEEAFLSLVREYAESGVSGVYPKFLSPPDDQHSARVTIPTQRYIVKSSSARMPFVALVEHLSMEVARRSGVPTATTTVSQDGQILLVERFDVDPEGRPLYGFEDFCGLLGLRPANKYETTWERILKQTRALVPPARHTQALGQLATILLLTHALRNADCHAKNIAVRYTTKDDVQIAPVCDMLTTQAFADFELNPPGLSFLGKKTWTPGKNLPRFLQAQMGLPLREQKSLVERIGDAQVEVAQEALRWMQEQPEFTETGYRMLRAWNEGIRGLYDARLYALPIREPGIPTTDALPPTRQKHQVIGRSPLLGPRGSV